jgi:hypothetical protein
VARQLVAIDASKRIPVMEALFAPRYVTLFREWDGSRHRTAGFAQSTRLSPRLI